ncbi:MAG: hypothetical protein OEW04_11150 [Nitrospirota bacterium]|nr:hypothetical protein [Nitrospirota bacterium]
MKKIIFLVLIGVASVLLLSQGTSFAISGVCSNCHTMHNSQNGLPEVGLYNGSGSVVTSTDPQDYLLKANCIGCHTTDAVAPATAQKSKYGAPAVLHINDISAQTPGGGYTNAGGDFYWVATGLGGKQTYGHNVAGLAAADTLASAGPPGYDGAATSGFTFGQVAGGTWSSSTNQVTCDGVYGCHGAHFTVGKTGITGAHHSNTGLTQTQATVADTVGNSYRFLAGIKGLENSQWNFYETTSSHNEYYGVNDTSNRNLSNTTYTNKDTISFLCAECHGKFHAQIDDSTTGTPWRRHPTDIVLPNDATKEYSNYNEGGGYNLQAPVARGGVPASSSSTVNIDASATGAIAMCLSCHRAHGSNQPDLLRWDYNTQVAGGGNLNQGCFVCHTTKDTGW